MVFKKNDRKISIGDTSLQVVQTIVAHHPEIQNILVTSWISAKNFSDKRVEEQKSNLSAGLRTNGYIDEIGFKREEFLEMKLEDLPLAFDNQLWGVVSKVTLKDSTTMHIPMMDIDPKGLSIEEMVERVKLICGNKPGALLRTDHGIHYYGDYLIAEDEWVKTFLSQFLLLQGLDCNRYIGHAMARGNCNLRLMANGEIKKSIPRVIEIL